MRPKPHNPILLARIEQGRVVWLGIDGKRWDTVKRFLEGQEVQITIGRRQKRATPKQRKYYWAVIVPAIAEAAGMEEDEAHEALKWQFLRVRGDEALPTVRSTESLTTAEREDYHESCRRLAAQQFGLYIPNPNEVALEQG